MAHTFSIYDGVEGTTLALAGTSDTGYRLLTRERVMPDFDERRNASLYADGDIPVASRHLNVTETCKIEVSGSTVDDMLVKLRALMRAVEHARDYMELPGARQPTYLIDKPSGSTNTSYSVLITGRVDGPALDSTITDEAEGSEGEYIAGRTTVTLTLEREPFWRETAPLLSTTITDWAPQQATATVKADFGKLDVTSVPGDIPALCRLHVIPTNVGNYTKIYLGYRSQARGGSNYNAAGIKEVENSTFGTDTANFGPDAGASPSAAAPNAAYCTFATYAGYANRITIAPTLGYGSYRVFARVRPQTAGESFGMYLQYYNGTPTIIPSTPKVIFTPATTSWAMVDLGVVTHPVASGSELLYTTANTPFYANLWISRISGSGYFCVDLLFFLPVDEYVIIAPGGAGTYPVTYYAFDNIMPHALGSALAGNSSGAAFNPVEAYGTLLLPPGNGSLYYITTDSNYNNVFTTAVDRLVLTLYRCARYLSARGNT